MPFAVKLSAIGQKDAYIDGQNELWGYTLDINNARVLHSQKSADSVVRRWKGFIEKNKKDPNSGRWAKPYTNVESVVVAIIEA